MTSIFEPYNFSILIIGLTGALSLVQLLIFDLMAIKLKHPPGYPIESSHKNLLFRLFRAHANTNETLGAMIVLFLFVLFSQADATWVNRLMLVYFCSRLLHMIFYYLGWSAFRGVVFGLSILSLLGLLVVGLTKVLT